MVRRQHGLITRAQLLAAGHTSASIGHRLGTGRLHPVRRGVYAVGRPATNRLAILHAAVLCCGEQAMLSHASAAWLLRLGVGPGTVIDVSRPGDFRRRHVGIRLHRRGPSVELDRRTVSGIPVTGPACSLIDLATVATASVLERAVNEADRLDLIRADELRLLLGASGPRPGIAKLRRLLDRRTFVLTASELERLFPPIARRAGLPTPQTAAMVNGFAVDFWWPDLGLVVETDGLRYHRTPTQQARDRVRDQVHTAAGLTPLRFTHAQVRFEPERVERILGSVVRRLR